MATISLFRPPPAPAGERYLVIVRGPKGLEAQLWHDRLPTLGQRKAMGEIVFQYRLAADDDMSLAEMLTEYKRQVAAGAPPASNVAEKRGK